MGLGIDPEQGLRRCEEPFDAVPNGGAPLFWTLGGNQVGRAAIAGWQLIRTALEEEGCSLWPFDGTLSTLLSSSYLTIVETYPAVYYTQLGMPRPGQGWSKRDLSDRRDMARFILGDAYRDAKALAPGESTVDPLVRRAVVDGFDQPNGDDPFDAVVGLHGMLMAIGHGNALAPQDSDVQDWEGWILGRPSDSPTRQQSARPSSPAMPPQTVASPHPREPEEDAAESDDGFGPYVRKKWEPSSEDVLKQLQEWEARGEALRQQWEASSGPSSSAGESHAAHGSTEMPDSREDVEAPPDRPSAPTQPELLTGAPAGGSSVRDPAPPAPSDEEADSPSADNPSPSSAAQDESGPSSV